MVRLLSLHSQASLAENAAIPRLPGYPWHRLVVGLTLLGVLGLVAASFGSVAIPQGTLLKIVAARLPFLDLAPDWPASWETIVWQLRLPRLVLAALVGASLASAGATYQGLFRNPLADPYLIGVAAGAGLGATVVLVTPVPLYLGGVSLLPLAAFGGALAAVSIAYTLARQGGTIPLTSLILAGVAIAALAGAITSLLMIRSDPDIRPLLGWLMGGFATSHWEQALMVLPYVLPSLLVMLAYSRILNLLQLDEEQAKQLGVHVERTKLVLIVAASLATAAAVSVSGLIGFVGLLAPHAVRLVWGPDHRFLLPMAMLVGAGFLVLADLAARTVVSPGELPVGVVTAFCGVPFFLYLLRATRQRVA
ncbi:MAG: FecCD family ABC transporter permease [Dehalococcoidia bacterium]